MVKDDPSLPSNRLGPYNPAVRFPSFFPSAGKFLTTEGTGSTGKITQERSHEVEFCPSELHFTKERSLSARV